MKVIFFIIMFASILFSQENKTLAYLVSDVRIPFWNIMSKGVKSKAKELGYEIKIYSANNLKKLELENLSKALQIDVDGMIISPINSSTAVTILKIAKNSDIPVTISDVGTESGEYISYISANNKKGAYEIGKVLVDKMEKLNWDKKGSVGIIAIPQKRENGKDRTIGFLKAMDEANIKVDGLVQQVDFSYEETYNYTIELIKKYPNLRAIWLQGSDRYAGALNAIKDSGKEILLISFDAEPEFIDMIKDGTLVGSAMQQPYLMGQKAVENLVLHLNGKKVPKNEQYEILAISDENIDEKLPIIKKNVLGIEE